MSGWKQNHHLLSVVLHYLALCFSEGAIKQQSYMTYHDKGMTGTTAIRTVQLLRKNTTCPSLCLATTTCCSYSEEASDVCALVTCPTKVVKMTSFSFIAVSDLFQRLGFSPYQSDKMFKVIPGSQTWVDCKVLCVETFDWATLFVPRSAADIDWIVDTALLMTPQNNLFIGLQSDVNRVFTWANGRAYNGVYGQAVTGQDNNVNEIACMERVGPTIVMYQAARTGCSCLCQIMLP